VNRTIKQCIEFPLVSILLLSLSCSNQGSRQILPFMPAGPESAPDPAKNGPFPVGVTTVMLQDDTRTDKDTGRPRPIPLEIFYPAVQSVRNGPFWTYELAEEAKDQDLGDKYDKIVEAGLPGMATRAVRDAELDKVHGPYPVIIFSHGSYGIRWQSVSLVVHLASHGYIVAAPDHEGNTVWDLIRDGYSDSSTMQSAPYRLDDVKFVIDWLIDQNEKKGSFLEGTVDGRDIGVSGHSFGGFTAVTMPCVDNRVKAALGESPAIKASTIWGCDLAKYPVPLMAMGGTMDQTLNYKDQYCSYREVEAPAKYLCQIDKAGHYTFSDICSLDLLRLSKELDFGPAEEALNDGCSPENIDRHDATVIIDHYATAFFNWKLRNSPGSKDYLSEQDDPRFRPVTFFDGDPPDWPDGGCVE